MSHFAIAGRTLMIGLPGPDLDGATAERVSRLSPGGVILFARNLESAEQTRSLLDELQRLVPHPLLRGLDQEGGQVSRLAPWVGETPTAETLARHDVVHERWELTMFARGSGRADVTSYNDLAPRN